MVDDVHVDRHPLALDEQVGNEDRRDGGRGEGAHGVCDGGWRRKPSPRGSNSPPPPPSSAHASSQRAKYSVIAWRPRWMTGSAIGSHSASESISANTASQSPRFRAARTASIRASISRCRSDIHQKYPCAH